MTIRALIVDDEPLARRGLRDLLASSPDIEVVGESPDGIQAVTDIERQTPDLVFLDVQMPGLDGFEVLAACDPARAPVVVFVTAHDAHALRAFDAHAIDYLLKPIDPGRLRVALDRARAIIRGYRDETGAADASAIPAESGISGERRRIAELLVSLDRGYATRLLARSSGSIAVVAVAEIDWIQADGDYARVHTAAKAEHLLRETIQSLERRLDPADFVRIHRSYLVRIDRVRKVQSFDNGDGSATLNDGTTLPISRTWRAALIRSLEGRDAK
jgi:two-component system LytT family response regulator